MNNNTKTTWEFATVNKTTKFSYYRGTNPAPIAMQTVCMFRDEVRDSYRFLSELHIMMLAICFAYQFDSVENQ